MNNQPENTFFPLGPTLDSLLKSYQADGGVNQTEGTNLPSYQEVATITRQLRSLLFPGFFDESKVHQNNLPHWTAGKLNQIFHELKVQIAASLIFADNKKCEGDCLAKAEQLTKSFLAEIPQIRKVLATDIQAAFNSDPAAKSQTEIILSYPGLLAISFYRLAHELHLLGVPLIPRMMTEYAHSQTGVDIHPAAEIEECFFIDHGTGVVIGATAKIGKNVTIYQQVTLGSLRIEKNEQGQAIKDKKRHPTIEDHVVLYAGSTILGGDTVIGKGSTIGGNVWISKSVAADTVIFFDVSEKKHHSYKKYQKVAPEQLVNLQQLVGLEGKD